MLTSVANVLTQVLIIIFLCMSYHMATLTMQHHKRTREMKGETLSYPLKHKPFGFNKSLQPFILSAFCCFLENVMSWFHPCTLCPPDIMHPPEVLDQVVDQDVAVRLSANTCCQCKHLTGGTSLELHHEHVETPCSFANSCTEWTQLAAFTKEAIV